ncbi:MAG: hypothetical protein OXC40_00180, partial [Proteobacteria bacterium]|nr:hypothetical protein [Pseudomonadota bacterium]
AMELKMIRQFFDPYLTRCLLVSLILIIDFGGPGLIAQSYYLQNNFSSPEEPLENLGKASQDRGPRVRIKLVIDQLKKIDHGRHQAPSSHPKFKRPSFVRAPFIKKTLRAHLERPNHFIVGPYHIETIPLRFQRKDHRYMIRLSFTERFGKREHIEKHLGYLDVEGILLKQKPTPASKQSLYLLIGQATKNFFNNSSEPTTHVTVGFPGNNPLSLARQNHDDNNHFDDNVLPSFVPRKSLTTQLKNRGQASKPKPKTQGKKSVSQDGFYSNKP